ncbi:MULTISPECIES: 8-oxoguanine deaminase [Paraburkholderia]|uniref:Cytosine/adenosine deaminase-related metal-dependent hydrolase n=1 Tax=Paraburkholderia tropica TaxID=92647 RepID=A0ABX5MFC5_9BURK|nr:MULTISPECIES: 8-oxoguanine deaminase [Paraburkholderia]MBB2999481.1 cytosine/adenosine deaminase-related metal-dependent hydrolase [Paraburkholderia tropica]MBB6317937.1 cytosine/adenosine deaminase-related metal-dependent hydrolase [Paraburkholderia tropica]MDE1141243.1 8-oxoguanine deaminase [Paraburkholderia tropica]PXX08625.1 cytosine/adenosine deaminase-related metal-dependent hydrolase [Paraburkholderia tropica]PZW73923.1 cytosine/adenosine deaminase-related metal-dependent hydrolase 
MEPTNRTTNGMAREPGKGKTLLVKNADMLVTMDGARREIRGGGLYVEDNRIVAVGPTAELPSDADDVIDATGHLITPGLVNTHHHMYQSLTRALPAAQNAELFGWLTNLYKVWANLTPEMIEVSTLTAMAELLLSGCTTSSDHLYIYPNGSRLDDSIRAAQQIGMRFHASRGSMSVGQKDGGLPPDSVVEREDAILADTQRLIETYHDEGRYAMLRVVVAPCSPFSVSRDLMRESATLARHYGVSMHTHLAENVNDIAYSREKFGMTPAQYAEDLGWIGPDVWHAHCVQLDDHGIGLFGRTGTGVAHCPCSNMRLASGIAPVKKMRLAGVPVGLGVDGSASNDGAQMVAEARQAMLLARVGFGPDAMTAREALEIATLGGAKVLGRDDIGALAPGMAADFVAFDLRQPSFAGALHDPVAALVFCAPSQVALSVIGGRVVVKEGVLQTVELGPVIERHNALAARLVQAAR